MTRLELELEAVLNQLSPMPKAVVEYYSHYYGRDTQAVLEIILQHVLGSASIPNESRPAQTEFWVDGFS